MRLLGAEAAQTANDGGVTLVGLLLDDLGITLPVLAAPMAGGPTTPAMAIAASAAGSFGFVAAGYKSADAVADEIRTVRETTPRFGVNLFAPNPIAVNPTEYAEYRRSMQREAERFGFSIELTEPIEDDDAWQQKLDALIGDPVPVVSFTFGIPDAAAMRALKTAGSVILLTVTSADEASAAIEAGADALIVQASAAGGHSATLTPRVTPPVVPIGELLQGIRSVTSLPLIAAGGISTPEEVTSALAAGADAATVGTALLRSAESGASETHQNALADPSFSRTVITRAFTGRPARALSNDFTDRHDASAPSGYPAVHHLTKAIRRAAAAAGDPQSLHLWAGTGYRAATTGATGQILTRLASWV
ncbi:nitronate monooxygenase [Homoserinimonas sp. A447]